MLKHREVSDPNSCLNKADKDEPIFVLRAKDIVAVDTVRAWIDLRVKAGKNRTDDPKILEAHDWCRQAEEWQKQQTADQP